MAGISNNLMTGQLVPWETSYDSNFFLEASPKVLLFTFKTLMSACIFSSLFSIHFLWYTDAYTLFNDLI